jgi:hypothetical protein
VGQLSLDPLARFSRVAANQDASDWRVSFSTHHFHQRGADAPDRGRVERIRARGAPDSIGPKQRICHPEN